MPLKSAEVALAGSGLLLAEQLRDPIVLPAIPCTLDQVHFLGIECVAQLFAGLGALAAWVGGASVLVGASRVAFWGVLAMGVTALVGRLFGTAVN